MTDARLPERWLSDRRLQRLSAEHYRTFINALLWSVTNRTDGRIEREDVGLIPHWSANAAKAFVDAGLFTPQSDGWLISDYAATQTARSELETLERIRQRDRLKKARKRAGDTDDDGDSPGDSGGRSPGDSTGDSPGEVSPGTAQEGRQAGRKEGNEGERVATAIDSEAAPVAAVNGHRRQTADWPQWQGGGSDPFEEYK
ncbi:hypothetical protein [Mycolicibacter kumamotonensis]|uniref:hypothetical protein n=1 Tax=Mycolicibacter kumamotonensis TaxID=354243 RepID=UPI00080669F6|nr:hypothetical protein [Mycolicibacter kumamotonensis]